MSGKGAKSWHSADKESEKGRVETTSVKRYRPGQAPEWMRHGEEDADEGLFAPSGTEGERARGAPLILRKGQTKGLSQLSVAFSKGHATRKRPERKVVVPQILKKSIETCSRSLIRQEKPETRKQVLSADKEFAERRALLKEKILREQQEEEEDLDDATEDGSSEEDYTEESEDSEERFSPLAQPLFVPKAHRQTIAEREALEREELQRVEQEKIRSSRRAQETKEIAAQKVAEDQAQEELAALGPKGAEDINTDDDSNPEEDYQAWKSREIERLRRDLEEKLKHEKEEQEKEIWRKMSEKDRDRYLEMKSKEARASSMAKIEDKAKWNFLQKYYHKGAFFQTEAEYKGEEAPLVGDLKNRDISSATGDDVFDKASLPRVMQVKNFGKRGQTKWTHLAAEDTTNLQSKTPK